MSPSARFDADGDSSFQVLWEDGDRVFCRGWRRGANGERDAVLVVLPAAEHPTPASLDRLAHWYALKDELEGAWAVRPLSLEHQLGRTMLVLEDPGGELLARQLGAPMEVERFLRLAVGISAALGKLHRRGLVHKDLKPSKILVDCPDGQVRLTGLGLTSRLPRERQAPDPPEFIAGTLAYMAPEQTGRMNRSIDARSDLYSLGIVFYEMLTGSLPFTATDPMEWVHCHVARRPVPPAERLPRVPAVLSAIIMRLLAKAAEDRYQTAAGLERDLRGCLAEWEAKRQINDFPLGRRDTPDRLFIPEKLYGREREIAALREAFDRVVKGGPPELVLVSGYSGVGKSSVVNELHKVLVPLRALFAAGKFDQYRRDIPHSTLAQAFQSLVRPLLAKSDTELSGWRDALLEALGPNGRLMVDVVPELKLIIREQPPVPELPPQDAQRRFQLVFRRFVSVFARPEHPLALFLDDLQWLDAATLDLLEDLLTGSDLQHLMLIGAYRDNEITADHPLMRKLGAIEVTGGKITPITLAPLAEVHLRQLIADALRCEASRAAPLAQLVHEKTGGNPFFAIQFLSSLADAGMLAFDYDSASWSWDLERIHARGYTDNVVDLMVAKLTRLPVATQTALQQLACLGNIAEMTTVAIVLGASEEQVHAALWLSVRQELVERGAGTYRFVHDRVQEAAYSLITDEQRSEAHLRIGRLLAEQTPPARREETIFEIVNQLNRAIHLITSRGERDRLAEFNLIAGRRAKASTAYDSALKYLVTGAALLDDNGWRNRHELIFALELNRAECEFLTGSLAEAEQRLTALSARAATTIERASVACLRVDLYVTADQSGRAVDVGLDYLRHLGVKWSANPTEEEARSEYELIWTKLEGRSTEALVALPLMRDPASLATLDVLTKLALPASHTDANLHCLVICRAVNISLGGGNSDASCVAYVRLGMVAGASFSDYKAGYPFGQLGYQLVERLGFKLSQARTYMLFGAYVIVWTRHVRAGRDLLRRAFDAANQIGDLTYAAFSCDQLNTNLLAAGDPLLEVQREAEHGLAFAQKARFGLVVDDIATQLGLVRTLRGLTPKFGCFDDEQFDESRIERRFASNPDLARAECWYWIRKLQARYFAGDYAAAAEASSRAQRLLWTSPSHFETAEYHLYGALARAALCDLAAVDQRQQHVQALAVHHQQLEIWAAHCRENFENRTALVGAEIARIEGRAIDAEHLYEQAIRAARANGFIHNEALAYELAARFYAARGFDEFARVYLRNARDGYLRWGADGKVRQLDDLYPHLTKEEGVPGPTGTIGTPVEHLDLATVIKVSQAVSGEIVLNKLLDTLLRTALEYAGAERGLLILPRGAEQRVVAEATITGDTVSVHLRDEPISAVKLPDSIIRYVARTRESVILDDAAAESSFSWDPYVGQYHARSVLCLPLMNESKLTGQLYLENSLTPGVFTPNRTAVLKLLASQAAISLENAVLHTELGASEERWRSLFENVPVGVMLIAPDGRYFAVNRAFQSMVGYSETELLIRSPIDITLEDDRAVTKTVLAARAGGNAGMFRREKRYRRKDGSIIWADVSAFLVPVARGAPMEAVFAVDITHRKQAEEDLREVQTELAHANRLATMGQLTASIAHEVNQPIAATVTNAQAALRWLGRRPPDLEEVRQTLDRIVENGARAGEVVGRIRALIQKARPRKDRVEINGAIQEVIELTHSEAMKNGVAVQTQLKQPLPWVLGDRVQLQQVILNLVVNAVEAMSGVGDGVRDLVVSTDQVDTNSVLVAVRDSGPGLAPESVERIFAPFYTTKPAGLGMGLSICRSIIEAHGGRLWVTANRPRGAIFQFALPP